VQDRLEIQMLHDRVMVRDTEGTGERRSNAGIVIPATAAVASIAIPHAINNLRIDFPCL